MSYWKYIHYSYESMPLKEKEKTNHVPHIPFPKKNSSSHHDCKCYSQTAASSAVMRSSACRSPAFEPCKSRSIQPSVFPPPKSTIQESSVTSSIRMFSNFASPQMTWRACSDCSVSWIWLVHFSFRSLLIVIAGGEGASLFWAPHRSWFLHRSRDTQDCGKEKEYSWSKTQQHPLVMIPSHWVVEP